INIINYTSVVNFNTKEINYPYLNLFPSLNISYDITEKQKLRFAYGTSINRPEFRELSPSVYYDFDLFSDVAGNPKLKPAIIQNIDFRYEYYPSANEFMAMAIFYKHFKDPIESTYYNNGGNNTFSFENGTFAHDIGVELDIRKNLDFIGIKDLMLILNGAYIYTRVSFDANNSPQVDRPMQGQSPYIINAGFTYDLKKIRMNFTAMYNRIGRRLINVGRVDKTNTGEDQVNNSLPDIYEMPRDILDISIGKKIGKYVELRLAAQNIINYPVAFMQFPKFYDANHTLQNREQTTQYLKTGSTFTLTIAVNF
ncbi:MAG: TonB-dependent receptor domain-containing protein, partial [Chitinophagaceae bacterium]